MEHSTILNTAKRIIQEELKKHGYKVVDIILFGSRARGDAQPDSDWDFLITVDKDIDFQTRKEINKWIRRKLVKLNMASDLIIQSQGERKERENQLGYITYYAVREGIVI